VAPICRTEMDFGQDQWLGAAMDLSKGSGRLHFDMTRGRFPPLLLSPWFYGHWHAVSRPQGDETLRFDGMASLEA
jgi:hypothetical protein